VSTVSINSRPAGFASGSSSPSVGARFKRVLAFRRILRLLVSRDLKVRYAGSALGYVWTVLDPLLMSLVYWFVFTKIFHRDAGPGFSPYMLYLVIGQLSWSWFAGGVGQLTRALRSEAQMVRSSNVPRELWVLRVVVSKGTEYVFGLPVLALYAVIYAALGYHHAVPNRYMLLLPLGIVMEFVLLVGLGLILAPVTVLFNDMERIVPIVMRVLFYSSPVLYGISLVPKAIQTAFSFNPAVGFLTIAHAAFFPAAIHETRVEFALDSHGKKIIQRMVSHSNGSVTPHYQRVTEHLSHWDWIWHSAIVSVVILAIGIVVFTRLERPVLKEI
jgi:ABC-2 type transport system permease protein